MEQIIRPQCELVDEFQTIRILRSLNLNSGLPGFLVEIKPRGFDRVGSEEKCLDLVVHYVYLTLRACVLVMQRQAAGRRGVEIWANVHWTITRRLSCLTRLASQWAVICQILMTPKCGAKSMPGLGQCQVLYVQDRRLMI